MKGEGLGSKLNHVNVHACTVSNIYILYHIFHSATPSIQLTHTISLASTQLGTGPIIAIIVVAIVLIIAIALVAACIVVVWYGYKNPTSSVGLFMIEVGSKHFSMHVIK